MNRLNLPVALFALVAPIGVASAATYSAVPVTPSAQSRVIGRDIVWRCGPDSCAGVSDASRPVVLCENLARQAGRIEKFDVNGLGLGSAELAACNRAARDRQPSADAAVARAN